MYKGIDPKTNNEVCCWVDTSCRVYDSWRDWETNNRWPMMKYCYPKNGLYTCSGDKTHVFDKDKDPDIEFGFSPACSTKSRFGRIFDSTTSLASLGAGGLALASIWVMFPPALILAAGGVLSATALYGMARCVILFFQIHILKIRKKINKLHECNKR